MDVSVVLVAVASSVPPTIAALAAYRRSVHTSRRIGTASHAEQRRVKGRGRRAEDFLEQGLSVNTILGIMHADIIDIRDEVQENTRLTNRTREQLQRHVEGPPPKRR